MFIEDMFCSLRDSLMETGLFSVGYEYVRMKEQRTTQGVSVRPQYYKGGWIDVQNWDVNGVFYLRREGKTRMQKYVPKMNVQPCLTNKKVEMDMPLRCVASVLKTKFESVQFAEEMLISSIIEKLQGKLSAVELNIIEGEVNISSFDTEGFRVWQTENQGRDFPISETDRFAYVAVDFTVTIKADVSCLSACQNAY